MAKEHLAYIAGSLSMERVQDVARQGLERILEVEQTPELWLEFARTVAKLLGANSAVKELSHQMATMGTPTTATQLHSFQSAVSLAEHYDQQARKYLAEIFGQRAHVPAPPKE